MAPPGAPNSTGPAGGGPSALEPPAWPAWPASLAMPTRARHAAPYAAGTAPPGKPPALRYAGDGEGSHDRSFTSGLGSRDEIVSPLTRSRARSRCHQVMLGTV